MGTYASELMGDAVIERQGEGMVLRMAASLRGRLEAWRGPVFRVHFEDEGLGTAVCTFAVGADGAVSGFELEDHGKFVRRR